MYVKLVNNEVDTFPYTLKQLRQDNPSVSFPKEISDELAAQFNVYPVRTGSLPARNILVQTLNRQTEPTFRDGQWWIDYEVEFLVLSQAEKNIRIERDMKLAETDWVVTKHAEAGTSVPTEWITYRQALRDITNSDDFPFDVTWPTKP